MLTWMVKLWHIFIAHNLHSSYNISEVTKAKSICLYAIVKNIYFDVGKMIEEDILSNISARCTKTFGHPALITTLCLQHNVMVGSNEERIQPMLPLSETTLRGKRQTTTPEGAYDSRRAESSDKETPAEPSFPRICDTGALLVHPLVMCMNNSTAFSRSNANRLKFLTAFWLHSRLFHRAKHYSAIGKISFVKT